MHRLLIGVWDVIVSLRSGGKWTCGLVEFKLTEWLEKSCTHHHRDVCHFHWQVQLWLFKWQFIFSNIIDLTALTLYRMDKNPDSKLESAHRCGLVWVDSALCCSLGTKLSWIMTLTLLHRHFSLFLSLS